MKKIMTLMFAIAIAALTGCAYDTIDSVLDEVTEEAEQGVSAPILHPCVAGKPSIGPCVMAAPDADSGEETDPTEETIEPILHPCLIGRKPSIGPC